MNKLRRKQLQAAADLLEEARAILEAVRDEEQESFDNMPEGLQCSERGEAMEANIYTIEESMDSIGDLVESLTEI